MLMFKIKCMRRKEANLNGFDIKVLIQYGEPSSKFFSKILGSIHWWSINPQIKQVLFKIAIKIIKCLSWWTASLTHLLYTLSRVDSGCWQGQMGALEWILELQKP